MVNAWISEFPRLPQDKPAYHLPIAVEPALRTVLLAFTTSTRVALGADAAYVAMAVSVTGYFRFGDETVVATASDFPITPGAEQYRAIGEGATHVAFYDGTSV